MKFSLSDWIVTSLVFVLSTALLYLFINDLNAISNHGNEPVLGTIFFKKQTATRKSPNSRIWERLRNESPVYQLDTLRTSEDSEAVVDFEDGLSMDMFQNTMLTLNMKGAATNLDAQGGMFTLHGNSGKSGTVSLGNTGRTLSFSADAQVVVTQKADTISLELSQGSASISDKNGLRQELSPSSAVDLNAKTGAVQVRPVELIPQGPVQGARLLSLDNGLVPVGFVYQVSDSAQLGNQPIEIQLSQKSDFSAIVSRVGGVAQAGNSKIFSADIKVAAGTWYWRVAAGDQKFSSTRQFTLNYEMNLRPIEPGDGREIAYRRKLPAIRFSWTAGEHVAFWDIEIAASADGFKTPKLRRRTNVSSILLDGLPAGTWYWRVIPHYTGTILTPESPPIANHFSIIQRSEMTAITPSVPVEGTLVQTQELATKGLSFAWDPVPEATRYELTAYRNPRANGPAVAHFVTTSSYKTLDPHELGKLSGEGNSYWVLRWFDDEGNGSPLGPVRGIQAIDGNLALRLTYPPDGYKAADRFITNVRFSWKSNITTRTVFQVSRNQDFQNVLFEEPVKDQTKLGNAWGSGGFYWRLITYNANGSVFIQTQPRRIEVVEPFPLVHLNEPKPGALILVPEQADFPLSWSSVSDADYYLLSLFAAGTSGDGSRVVYQTSVDQAANGEAIRFKLPIDKLPEGAYVARIQAFAREKTLSTSIIGLYGDSSFSFRRLAYTKLVTPANGTTIDGLQALRKGILLRWSTPNPPPDGVVELTELSSHKVVFKSALTTAPLKVARLKAGEYSWTVRGSIEGFDLSARKPNRFVVSAIPKLPAAVNLIPADKTIFGPDDIRKMKGLDFSWTAVSGAQEYIVRLYEEKDISSLATPDPINKTSSVPVIEFRSTVPKVSLEKLGLLKRGPYYWEVEAHTLGADGLVEQEGIIARSHFLIDLPILGQPKLPKGKIFYGR